MALDESSFATLAEETLEGYMDAIEDELGDYLEADLDGGVLTIELDSGGQYVINPHRPNRQIWMSSPVSGASHFGWDEAGSRWVSTRGGAVLGEMLAQELAQATGEAFSFD